MHPFSVYLLLVALQITATFCAVTSANGAQKKVLSSFGYTAGGWRVDRHPRLLGDINGDGKIDIVGFGNAGIYVSLGKGNGLFSTPYLALGAFGYSAGGWRVDLHPRMLADVNGDGILDIVGFGNDGTYVSFGLAHGYFSWPHLAVKSFGYSAGGWRQEKHPRMLEDINGDGKIDIIGFGNSGAYVSLGQGNGYFNSPFLAINNFGYTSGGWRVDRHPRFVTDINGDGKADIVGFGNAGIYVSYGQSDGRFGSATLVLSNFGYTAGGWRVDRHPRLLADVNGDNKIDIIGFGNAGVYVALGIGNGNFHQPHLSVANYGYDAGGWRVSKHPRFMADVNGDGKSDIVGFGNAGVYISLGLSNGHFTSPTLALGNFGYTAGGWRVGRHPRLLSDLNGDSKDDIIGFGNAGVYVALTQ